MVKKLSVVVPTSGERITEMNLTLKAIFKNRKKIFELIVINQGSAGFQNDVLKEMNFGRKLRWFNQKKKGKSKALDFAINLAKGDIFVIIDDDVIVSNDSFKVINNYFNKDKKLIVLLGQVKKFGKNTNKNLFCPCLSNFSKERELTINKLFLPTDHTTSSIMAVKKEVFEICGGFCEWSGPGTFVAAGDEWEFCYRLVMMGKKVLMSPKLVVYHNKFLDKIYYFDLLSKYYRSAMIVCFYLAIKYRKIAFIKNWNLYIKGYRSIKNRSLVYIWFEMVMAAFFGIFLSLFLDKRNT